MYKVFGTSMSGNCYKVKLLLEQLRLDYQWQEIDIFQEQSRTLEFLAMNPNGKVPMLQLGADRYLSESNAILCYLAEGTSFWSSDRFEKAETLQWMFFERHSHTLYIAAARFIHKFLPPRSPPTDRAIPFTGTGLSDTTGDGNPSLSPFIFYREYLFHRGYCVICLYPYCNRWRIGSNVFRCHLSLDAKGAATARLSCNRGLVV